MHFRNYSQLFIDVFHEIQPSPLYIKLIKIKYPQLPFPSPRHKTNFSNKPAFLFPLISLT